MSSSEANANRPTITLSANTSWYLANFRATTIRELLMQGFRVVCISPRDDYSDRLPKLGCEWHHISMKATGTHPFADLWLIIQLIRIYSRERPRCALHFTPKNNIYGTIAARLSGVSRIINNISGLGTALVNDTLISRIVKLLYRVTQPLASRVFCQNTDDYDLLVESGIVERSKLIQVPGSGVELDRFGPHLRLSAPRRFTFLFAGRMLAQKGVNELLSAFFRLLEDGYECQLLLCGFADVDNESAINRDTLENWASNQYIQWLGPTDKIEELLGVADCVVLPSYREGMPRILLEAGAMGLPSITTNVPGCREIVSDGENGILCEARNAESLHEAMVQILEMAPELRTKMGERARAIVEASYSDRIVVEMTMSAIHEISGTI